MTTCQWTNDDEITDALFAGEPVPARTTCDREAEFRTCEGHLSCADHACRCRLPIEREIKNPHAAPFAEEADLLRELAAAAREHKSAASRYYEESGETEPRTATEDAFLASELALVRVLSRVEAEIGLADTDPGTPHAIAGSPRPA